MTAPDTHLDLPHRQSFSARLRQKPIALSVAYIGIIIYASLYSVSIWRDNGVDPFAFLSAPWPRYWTWQDALFNVLAYLPLGFLLTLSPAHKRSPWARLLMPVVLGFALSATLEALQSFIPGRASSGLDLLLNTLGTLIGAGIALFSGPALLAVAGRLRQQLDVQRLSAESGLMLLALWLFAQISPETLFFGLGDLRVMLELPPALPFSPDLHIHLEMMIATLQTLVVALLLQAALIRMHLSWTRQVLITWVILLIGLAIRTAASWILLSQQPAVSHMALWSALTPGGLQGLVLGLVLMLPILALSTRWQMPLAATCLMAATVLVNLMPINPYSLAALSVWRQGHFLNFNGLTRLIATLWPYLTLLFLVWSDRRGRPVNHDLSPL